MHKHEERLLAETSTAAQTDHIYRTLCEPSKAVLDLIYQRHQSLCFDLALIWQTATRILWRRQVTPSVVVVRKSFYVSHTQNDRISVMIGRNTDLVLRSQFETYGPNSPAY